MAICNDCGREMLDGVGCIITLMANDQDNVADRIPYGSEQQDWGAGEDRNCHDCNCPPGTIHHGGCDVERCAFHPGYQAISCYECFPPTSDLCKWADAIKTPEEKGTD